MQAWPPQFNSQNLDKGRGEGKLSPDTHFRSIPYQNLVLQVLTQDSQEQFASQWPILYAISLWDPAPDLFLMFTCASSCLFAGSGGGDGVLFWECLIWTSNPLVSTSYTQLVLACVHARAQDTESKRTACGSQVSTSWVPVIKLRWDLVAGPTSPQHLVSL